LFPGSLFFQLRRETLESGSQHNSLNSEHFKKTEARGMFETLTKKSFKTIGHGVTEILFQAQVRAEVINKKIG